MPGDVEAPEVKTPAGTNGPPAGTGAAPAQLKKDDDPEKKKRHDDDKPDTSALQGFGILGAIAAVVLGLTVFKDIVFAGRWTPWLYAGGLVVLVVIGFMLPRGSKWVLENARRQGALLTFGIAPLLLFTVLAIVLAAPQWQFGLLRIGVIFVVCLTPPSLYYLFIVTRKGSLLNEFVSNVARLGLLQGDGHESETERRRRIEAYLQKFEAAFGQISETQREEILVAPYERFVNVPKASVGEVFVAEAAAPVVMATFLMALLWLITLPPVKLDVALQLFKAGDEFLKLAPPVAEKLTPWWHALTPNLTPVTAAFLGAYFFSLQLLFRRYIRKDLRPSAYMGAVLRIVISVISIWIVAIVGPSVLDLKDVGLTFIGFVIGVFPRVFLQIIEGVTKKLIPTAVLPSLKSQLPISDLDGLTVWHEARLEDEDIENTPNMATADLLELMINTRFPADRLVDWVDQAILYTCLGPEGRGENGARERLAKHGIRTATAFTEAYRQAATHDDDKAAFEKILSEEPRPATRAIADAIDTMPNTRLVRVWRRLPRTGFRMPRQEAETHP